MNTIQTIHSSSNEQKEKGTLFLVGMPIGNTEDMSIRARKTLEEVDFILAEDTKRAGLTLARCMLKTKEIFSLNEHNEKEKIPFILQKLDEKKNIALISDAGMPVISDPGYQLVHECQKQDYKVTVVAGPCAPVIALALSGIAPLPFTFLGFLPRADVDKEKTLLPFTHIQSTLLFFERKDRVYNTLKIAFETLRNRNVCIARELTKVHEDFLFFQLKDFDAYKEKLNNLLGEITIVLSPPQEQEKTSPEEIDLLIEEEKAKASSPRNLAKRVQARSLGWKTSDIYNRI